MDNVRGMVLTSKGSRKHKSEAEAMRDEGLRVLRVAVEEARSEPWTYLALALWSRRIYRTWEVRIVHYLAGQGLIVEGVNDYEFVELTLEGIAAGARY